ncbi:MAG: hypothetical protein N4A76_14525 [Firmicutes bacterium]|jgi:flavodoxin|nr:hypothetical protein [Bacillota bacterium]
MTEDLIIFYSRTGSTRTVAEKLKELLDCDIIEITDKKPRRGFLKAIGCSIDAIKKNLTDIEYNKKDLKKYNRIFIMTPIWASNIPPAIRTFLTLEKSDILNYKLILTYKGSDINKPIKEISEILDTYPSNTFDIIHKDIKSGSFMLNLNGMTK